MSKSVLKHTIWERIMRSIATNRLGWQINIRGDRKLLGVPEGTRQWIEFLIEEGFLGYGSAGSIEVKKTPSFSFMKRYEAAVAARVEAAQRRTCRPVRPEDLKLGRCQYTGKPAPTRAESLVQPLPAKYDFAAKHSSKVAQIEPKFCPLPRPSNYGKGPTIY